MTIDGGPRVAMVEDRDAGARARATFGTVRAGGDRSRRRCSTLLDIAAVIAENTLGNYENTLGNYVNNIARTPLDEALKRTAGKHLELAAKGVSR